MNYEKIDKMIDETLQSDLNFTENELQLSREDFYALEDDYREVISLLSKIKKKLEAENLYNNQWKGLFKDFV